MKSMKTRTGLVALAIALPLSLAACGRLERQHRLRRCRQHARRDVLGRHDEHALRHDDLVRVDGRCCGRLR